MSDYIDFRGHWDVPAVGDTVNLDTVGVREWLRGNMRDVVINPGGTLYKELFTNDEQWTVLAKDLKLADLENQMLVKFLLKILCELPTGEPITLMDFGGSPIEKVATIVKYLEDNHINCRYFVAGNCCLSVIRGVKKICSSEPKYVRASGIYGTASQVLDWAKKHIKGPMLFVSLGSTITNYEPPVQRAFLREWAKISSGMILGQDAPENTHADGEAIANIKRMKPFLRYGLWRCAELLPHPTLLEKHWKLTCEIKNRPFRHSWFLNALRDFPSWAGTIYKDHRIEMYVAFKYTEEEMRAAFREEGLHLIRVFKEPRDPTRIYVLDGERSWESRHTEAGRPEFYHPTMPVE